MIHQILLYAAAFIIAFWGTVHLFTTGDLIIGFKVNFLPIKRYPVNLITPSNLVLLGILL